MKVKGLISALKKLDPNLNIYIVDNIEGNDYKLGNIKSYEYDEFQGCVFLSFN